MLNSFRKWVQSAVDVTLDPPQIDQTPTNHHHVQLSTHSTNYLSRPMSMDNFNNSTSRRRSSSSTLPLRLPILPPSSPEIDLSHLNRDEQEHIAAVLRRARQVEQQEQHQQPDNFATDTISTSSSTSSSINDGQQLQQQPHGEENGISYLPAIEQQQNKHNDVENGNCEMCQKQLEQPLSSLCSNCIEKPRLDNNEIPTKMSFNKYTDIAGKQIFGVSKSKMAVPDQHSQINGFGYWNKTEEDDIESTNNVNNIYDNISAQGALVESIDDDDDDDDDVDDDDNNNNHNEEEEEEEDARTTNAIGEYASYISNHYNSQPVISPEENKPTSSHEIESSASSANVLDELVVIVPCNRLNSTRLGSLTEVAEEDFLYQGPSYAETIPIENTSIVEQTTSQPPQYIVDEIDDYLSSDEENNSHHQQKPQLIIEERDHIQELADTIANISRNFPLTRPITTTDNLLKKIVDINAIQEMEIEPIVATEPQDEIVSRPGSLSRSLGIHQKLNHISQKSLDKEHTLTITDVTENTSHTQPPRMDIFSKCMRQAEKNLITATGTKSLPRKIPEYKDPKRMKRNLPSIPSSIALRRTNSDSRFSLPDRSATQNGFSNRSSDPVCFREHRLFLSTDPQNTHQLNSLREDFDEDLLEIDLNTVGTKERSKTDSIVTPYEFASQPDLTKNELSSKTCATLNSSNHEQEEHLLSLPPKVLLKDQTTSTNDRHTTKKKVKRKDPDARQKHNLINGITKTDNETNTAETTTEDLDQIRLPTIRHDGTDLGLKITGGHSLPDCTEVTAIIETINEHHRNYEILKNAVRAGDEALEIGGVSLRGKSTLFVQNLMNSIQDEFEIVVRSQKIDVDQTKVNSSVLPLIVQLNPIDIVQEKKNLLTADSSFDMDMEFSKSRRRADSFRRYSEPRAEVATVVIPSSIPLSNVVKSHSTMIRPPVNIPSKSTSNTLLPNGQHHSYSLSVHDLQHTGTSSMPKERLFSVDRLSRESLHSSKSNEHLKKTLINSDNTYRPTCAVSFNLDTDTLPLTNDSFDKQESGVYNLAEHERKHSSSHTTSPYSDDFDNRMFNNDIQQYETGHRLPTPITPSTTPKLSDIVYPLLTATNDNTTIPLMLNNEEEPIDIPKVPVRRLSYRKERSSDASSINDQKLSQSPTSDKKLLDENNYRRYEHRNSLCPSDYGDRRGSNESDESDNLSKYFPSDQSRKSSLRDGTLPSLSTPQNLNKTKLTPRRSNSVNASRTSRGSYSDEGTASADLTNASKRLQDFLRSSSDGRNPSEARGKGLRLNFLKKKTKSVDFANERRVSQQPEMSEKDYVGDIQLQITHNKEDEQLVIKILRAKNLIAKDTNGFSDPFVKVYLLPGRDQENKRRTKHVSKSLNPRWDHIAIYPNVHREELQYKMVEFTVWDYDRFKANDFLGQVTIDLKDAAVIDDQPHWYRLKAIREREDTNRSSPKLFKMGTSLDSPKIRSTIATSKK
ncbi:unnamed protein product [Didymodactylos carnosus]|uniref:C2 domain-containing protein n=1 Tax=Didymodactylos carnosus TaxID=1234261 RepID=A0A813T407_9BILA|nr:unnamed protein product [Didymodactylos carnosus]CAF0961901.1 unnamed protein product [Didymodactylos carnosus]CAF3590406.1 unnamed protein product [Didymodactylos carnosus]CAF3734647.1 unnamed protein product [Didymodactylos carnosus]